MFESWAVPATLGVVCFTIFRVYQKRLSDVHQSLDLSFMTHAYATVFTAPVSLYFLWGSLSAFTTTVLGAIGISIIANVVGTVLLYKAYELEDMSVVVPLIGVQPLGVALIEPLLINGAYSLSLVLAGLFAAVGLYVVLIEGEEYFTPLRRLRERGPQFTLASTGVYIAAILADSFVVKQVSPVGYAFVLSSLTASAFLAILVIKGSDVLSNPRKMVSRDLAALGASRSVAIISVLLAFSLTTATKVNIFMQLSPVMAVLAGGTILREPHTRRRVFGAGLIVVAVAVALGVV